MAAWNILGDNRRELARQIAELEWKAAGSPPDQQAVYEARIQRYQEYPRNILERELERHRALRIEYDIRRALNDERAFRAQHGQRNNWAAAALEARNNQENNWVAAAPGTNPAEILGITTNIAPHIGIKNVPAGSENFISRDNIEEGDEMVELHGNPDHLYKKSSLNQWITTRKEQFPRNPIKNPYTGQNIKQQNMKRYTARLKSGGGCGCNGTRRMYGGYKKRGILRLRHKVTRKTRRVSRSRRR